MAEYPVNKGIGRSPEFRGLKSQYLFIFAGGLLALFVVFAVMYMAGIDQWVCIGFGVTCASAHPRCIINRKSFIRLFFSNHPKRRSV